MSLFKSIKNLAKASYELAKEDKQFRKEAAIAVATAPIWATKVTVDALDLATGATKNLNTACTKIDSKVCINKLDSEEEKKDFDTWIDKQLRNNELMSQNVEKLHKLKEMMSL
jgi:hypothetical protein